MQYIKIIQFLKCKLKVDIILKYKIICFLMKIIVQYINISDKALVVLSSFIEYFESLEKKSWSYF